LEGVWNVFCIECGTKLPEKAKFCPNCGAKISTNVDGGQVISQEETVPARQEVANLDKGFEKQYIAEIYNHILDMSEDVAHKFVEDLDYSFKDLDIFMSQGIYGVRQALSSASTYAIQLLQKQGIYHYGENEVRPYTMKYMGLTGDVLAQLEVAYENAIGRSQEALAYSDSLRDNHGYLIGGGFGIKGAAKGIALASAVNLTVGAFHNYAANARERNIASELSERKSSLYHSDKFRNALSFAIEFDIKSSIQGICELFFELGLGTLPYYPINNIMQAGNILDAVVSGQVPKSDIERVAFQLIDMYPVHRDMYIYASDICPKKKEIFSKMASEYGIDLGAYYESLNASAVPIAKRLMENPITKMLIDDGALSVDYKKDLSYLMKNCSADCGKRLGFCGGKDSNYKNIRAKMREYFADYPDTETPLLFFDASRYGDGKDGIVVTDKRVYAGGYKKDRSTRWALISYYNSVKWDYYKVGADIILRVADSDEKELPTNMPEEDIVFFLLLMDFFISLSLYKEQICGIRVVSKIEEEGFVDKLLQLANSDLLPGQTIEKAPWDSFVSNYTDDLDDEDEDEEDDDVEYDAYTLVTEFKRILEENKKHPTYFEDRSMFHPAIHDDNKWLDRDLRIINKVYDDSDKDEEILVFYFDPTIGGTFKESFLMTDKYIHCHSNKYGSWSLRYKDVESIKFVDGFFSYLTINGKRFTFSGLDNELKEFAYDLEHYFIPFFLGLDR